MADKDNAVNTTDAQALSNAPATAGANAPKSGGLKQFLRAVWLEMKKTTWPSKDELTKSTVVVITTIFTVAIFLWICDTAFGRFVQFIGIVK